MICQICGGATQVVDTGTSDTEIIRRRKCKTCGKIFYTVERKTDKYAGVLLNSYKVKKS